jgi:glycosyltransferase involved in cell wall biosynthesis
MEKIRVIHLITRLIVGGAQQNTMETCAYLNKNRFAAQIIAGPQTGPEGEILSEVRRKNIPLAIIPELVREVHPINDFIALQKIVALFKREQPHIVHTHSSKAGILGRWAARIAKVPVIIHTVHGWGHHSYQKPLIRRLFITIERNMEKSTDRLIAVSNATVEKGLNDRIGTRDKYTVIHSCINLDDFTASLRDPQQLKKSLGINPQSPVIGTVSRLSQQKNPLDFIRMAALIKQEVPESKFLFVGDGALRSTTETLIRELNLTDDVFLAGLRHDIADLLRCMDIFTLTSLWEGLPRVIPQAMAAGLPVVANEVEGTAEVIQDGINGSLIPPHDVSCMAHKVVQLLKDAHLRKSMGARGRETALSEFSLHDMIQKIETLYCDVLARKGINI